MKKTSLPPSTNTDPAARPDLAAGYAGDAARRGGVAAVRAMLADLAERGMKRPRGLTVAKWDAAQDRLAPALAYLTRDGLAMLAEQIQRRADLQEYFPSEVRIGNLARMIAEPPAAEGQLIPKFMRSSAGRAAWARSPEHALILLQSLERRRLPPALATWLEIDADAPLLGARIAAARWRVEAGAPRVDDGMILRAHDAEVMRAAALVFPGSDVGDAALDGAAS
jgi:hypothetical protein